MSMATRDTHESLTPTEFTKGIGLILNPSDLKVGIWLYVPRLDIKVRIVERSYDSVRGYRRLAGILTIGPKCVYYPLYLHEALRCYIEEEK